MSAPSATPILDRELPLPPLEAARPPRLLQYAVGVCLGAVISVCLVCDWPRDSREWVRHDLLKTWFGGEEWIARAHLPLSVCLLAAAWATIALHELGHLLGGLATGFRFRAIRAGPLHVDAPFRISLRFHARTIFSGATSLAPATLEGARRRSIVMVAAGPAATLATGIAAKFLLPEPWGGLLAGVSAVALVVALVPLRTRRGRTDGLALWTFATRPGAAERWIAIATLLEELAAGTAPEALARTTLAIATSEGGSGIETIVAHSIAHSADVRRGDVPSAARHLETCLELAGRVDPALRESMISDAVVHQARNGRRIDLAEAWRADLTPDGSANLRLRADAALMEAKGDIDGARAKLDELERSVSKLPLRSQRAMVLHGLGRWRADLDGAASPAALGRAP